MAQGFDEWLAERTLRSPNGCLVWQGSRGLDGYGKTRYQGWHGLVHRLVYIQAHGSVPEDREIGHWRGCVSRACCEITHLSAITHKQNMAPEEAGNHNRRKTHCPQGHAYEGQPRVPSGKRVCRICIKARVYAARAAKREAAV